MVYPIGDHSNAPKIDRKKTRKNINKSWKHMISPEELTPYGRSGKFTDQNARTVFSTFCPNQIAQKTF